jgi:sugar-specific transcriptional regulator TrmB
MFEAQLKTFGLTEGEARVYEALLSLGQTTVGPIVKRSGVAYSNIYEVLQRLMEKGLASVVVVEKTKYFSAVEPRRLLDYIAKQESELRARKLLLAKLMPSLEARRRLTEKLQEVEMFVGEKGLLSAYEALLKDAAKDESVRYFYYHDPVYYERAFLFYRKTWKLLRKLAIRAFGIANREYRKTEFARKLPSMIKQKYVDFPVPANIDIFRDKVLIVAWSDTPVGILIYSHEIAENFRRYFEAVWKIAK